MRSNIFSTYANNENRVTASILAVLSSLALPRIDRLVGSLLAEPEFQLARFDNQPAAGGQGVPDGQIRASCRILVETKIRRDAVERSQIERHLRRLDGLEAETARLLLLTPDEVRPSICSQIADERLVWASFALLHQAIDELIADPSEVVSEREAFLLRELQVMLVAEDLIASPEDVVVVAAREAWPEYLEYSAYICQPNRPFQQVSWMAFYCDGEIQTKVAKIRAVEDAVSSDAGTADEVGRLMARLVEDEARGPGTYKVFLLSGPEERETVTLGRPIPNDLRAASGRPWAFTLGQRYVSLEGLRRARTTSDLVRD